MSLKEDIGVLLAKIDEATNKVAARLDAYAAKVKNGMSDAEVAELKTLMGAEVSRLEAMGQDPSDPLPADTDPLPTEDPPVT